MITNGIAADSPDYRRRFTFPLKTTAEVSQLIKQPAAAQRPGLYPTRFTLRYDSADNTYLVALTGFVRH